MGREGNRFGPLETIFLVCRSRANRIQRPGRYILDLSGVVVIPGDLAAIRAGVDDLRIMRIGRDVSAFTSAHRIPIRTIDSTPLRRRSAYRAVVLLSAINEIREAIVGNHMVELRRRLVPLRSPACAAKIGRASCRERV